MTGDANDTMFAEERKLKIIDILNLNKKVTVTELVHLPDRIDNVLLSFRIYTVGILDIQNWVALRAKFHSLKSARQKPAVPLACGDWLRLAAAN